MTIMRLKPAAPRSRVKHSTTEPLRSQEGALKRKLRLSQVYKSLSLHIRFMISDINLNSRLNVRGNDIHRRRFQMNDLENCSGCLNHTSIKKIT